MARNPQLGTEYKFVLKDSPNFIGVAKGEDKLKAKVNEIIAAAKASGEIDKLAQKWLGRPAGEVGAQTAANARRLFRLDESRSSSPAQRPLAA